MLVPILLLGALVRGALFLVASPALLNNADAVAFTNLAVDGNFLGDAFHPPGWPFILRRSLELTGSAAGVTIVQHVVGLLAAAALYAAVRLLGGARWAAGGTALVAAASGDVVVLAHTWVSETWFTFLVAVALLLAVLLDRWRATAPLPRLLPLAVLLGAVLVGATIVRTIGLLLLPVVGIWLLGWRPTWRGAALVAAGALGVGITLGPYLADRQARGGQASLSPSAGWSAYGRIAQIADCTRTRVPENLQMLCDAEPGGAARRPDVRAAWFSREQSPALRAFGGPPAGNDELQAFADAVGRDQAVDVWGVRLRDVVRSAWPAYARRRALQIAGPDAEYAADVRWRSAENGVLGKIAARWPASYAPNEDALVAAWRVQALTRFWPWLFVPAALLAVVALLRARTRRRGVLLLGTTAFVLVAASAAIQLYNPRYGVPAQPLAAGAGLLALQALGTPAAARRAWQRRSWRRGTGQAVRRALSAAPARLRRVSAPLWLVLAGGALLRIATAVAVWPAVTDRGETVAALDQGRRGLWTDLVSDPANALWARLAHLLGLSAPVVVTVEHLIGLVTAGLAAAVVVRAGGPRWAAVAAAAVIALDPDRVALEHTAGVSSLGLAAALAAFLLLSRGTGARRWSAALAGAAALSVALVHVPVGTAWLVVLLVAGALVLAWRRVAGAPARAGTVVAVTAAALGLVALDRWDVAGGPLRLDASVPFEKYLAVAQRTSCPTGMAADVAALCPAPGEPRTRDALATRVRAVAPYDAAAQRWLLDRWLAAVGDGPPGLVAGLRSSWRATWMSGNGLGPLNFDRREEPSAPRLEAAVRPQIEELVPQLLAGAGDPHRISEPSLLPAYRRYADLQSSASSAAPDIREGALLQPLRAYQRLWRAPPLRWAALLVLLPLALVGSVRRPAVAVLAVAAGLLAVATASPGTMLEAEGLLVVAAAAATGVVRGPFRGAMERGRAGRDRAATG
ncbi:hypothetical protein ACVU7I_01385 [Patulibacter sp. S7RM1-6]